MENELVRVTEPYNCYDFTWIKSKVDESMSIKEFKKLEQEIRKKKSFWTKDISKRYNILVFKNHCSKYPLEPLTSFLIKKYNDTFIDLKNEARSIPIMKDDTFILFKKKVNEFYDKLANEELEAVKHPELFEIDFNEPICPICLNDFTQDNYLKLST